MFRVIDFLKNQVYCLLLTLIKEKIQHLLVSDDDDGCDFSKSLSKCLNLEIED